MGYTLISLCVLGLGTHATPYSTGVARLRNFRAERLTGQDRPDAPAK